MNWEKHLIFRTNLNLELFQTNTISEGVVHSYNELGYENINGRKDYFEFFYWTSKYLIQNKNEFATFENVVKKYKEVNSISANDETFILLSFKINEMILNFEDVVNVNSLELINNTIEKCLELEISDKQTLLVLRRLKLRYLLRNIADMSEDRAAELEEARNEVESLLVVKETESEVEDLDINSIFIS